MLLTKDRKIIQALANGCGVVILTEDEYNIIKQTHGDTYVTVEEFNTYITNNNVGNIVEIIDDIGPLDGLLS